MHPSGVKRPHGAIILLIIDRAISGHTWRGNVSGITEGRRPFNRSVGIQSVDAPGHRAEVNCAVRSNCRRAGIRETVGLGAPFEAAVGVDGIEIIVAATHIDGAVFRYGRCVGDGGTAQVRIIAIAGGELPNGIGQRQCDFSGFAAE